MLRSQIQETAGEPYFICLPEPEPKVPNTALALDPALDSNYFVKDLMIFYSKMSWFVPNAKMDNSFNFSYSALLKKKKLIFFQVNTTQVRVGCGAGAVLRIYAPTRSIKKYLRLRNTGHKVLKKILGIFLVFETVHPRQRYYLKKCTFASAIV